jgi:hypothetical protein
VALATPAKPNPLAWISHWRDVALGAADLWTDLPRKTAEETKGVLRRAGQALLRLAFESADLQSEAELEMAAKLISLPHVQSLRMEYSKTQFQRLKHAFSRPAHTLCTLSLIITPLPGEENEDEQAIPCPYGGQMPGLKHVTLSRCPMLLDSIEVSRLVSLDLARGGPTLAPSRLLELLQNAPGLELVALGQNLNEEHDGARMDPLDLPQLRILSMYENVSPALVVLQAIRDHQLEDIDIHWKSQTRT